ncbi:hypothetical protein [Neptuniibacter sp. QD37_11]|uniref:hypothetical protein n=1 Tax=Neptuniibacter sp. QD37_11 TaxID=3398209 RepID=UPI0039F5D199
MTHESNNLPKGDGSALGNDNPITTDEALTLDDPKHSDEIDKLESIEVDVEVDAEVSDESEAVPPEKKAAKDKKYRNPIAHLIMVILSAGAWSRFVTWKKGGKGSWGPYALIITLILTVMVAERFFKDEVNTYAQQELQLGFTPLPAQYFFEDGAAVPSTEMTAKLESLSAELEAKKTALVEAEAKVAAMASESANSSSAIEQSEDIAKLKAEIDERTAAMKKLDEVHAERVATLMALHDKDLGSLFAKHNEELARMKSEYDALALQKAALEEKPVLINTDTFAQASALVGCESRYSEERKADTFNTAYAGHFIRWAGEILHVDKTAVKLSMPEAEGVTAVFKFKSEGAGYDLLKGDKLLITGKLIERGDCNASFIANEAVINK